MKLLKKSEIENAKSEIKNYLEGWRANTVCFTGPRPQHVSWKFEDDDREYRRVWIETCDAIESSIQKGYTNFICGMALGFDLMCAEILIYLKDEYPEIKLYGAIPCKNQTKLWSKKDEEKYYAILEQLDGIRCIYDHYVEGCMQERNRYMINNSSLLIALNSNSSGTRQTIEYAKQQNLKIKLIEV